MNQRLLSQFQRPHGWLGHLAGLIMANRPSNVERNAWTLSLLDVRAADRVLEIGFGPGIAIRKASDIITGGHVVGLDHSAVMLAQASQRNAIALRDGRVTLVLGSLTALEELQGPFDKIYSVNVFMFWDNPALVFQSLRRLLSPSGVIATTVQPRGSAATNQAAIRAADRISEALREAGFSSIRREIKPMEPVSAACVLATNAAPLPTGSGSLKSG